jgi:hypothetical protein
MNSELLRKKYSYGTIQADPAGKFKDLLQRIETLPNYDQLLDKVRTVTPLRLMDLVLSNFLHCIDIIPVHKEKDDQDARKARMEGNSLFQKQMFQDALSRYNRSVLRASSSVSVLNSALDHTQRIILYIAG